MSNRPFGKLVGKVLYALESIFSDRPTLSEPFGINFSFVTYKTTYLYRETYALSRFLTFES